jgi:hypothetical protein
VMEFHRRLVDVRFERVVGVWKRRNGVGHFVRLLVVWILQIEGLSLFYQRPRDRPSGMSACLPAHRTHRPGAVRGG